jgi:hypothetical protein
VGVDSWLSLHHQFHRAPLTPRRDILRFSHGRPLTRLQTKSLLCISAVGTTASVNISGATKQCKMCCMEIPQQGRKCPYCHQFQDRRSLLLYHPALHIVAAMLPMLVMFAVIERMFSRGENYERYKDQITVEASGWMLANERITAFTCRPVKGPRSRCRFVGSFQKPTT